VINIDLISIISSQITVIAVW